MRKALIGSVIYLLFATCSAWGQSAMHYYNLGVDSSLFNRKVRYFSKALELNPQLAVAYEKRGRLYYFKEEYSKMLRDFTKFTALKPADPEGYRMLGLAYVKLTELDQAIEVLSRALELEPQLASAYALRAETYLLKGLLRPAIRDSSKAIELGGAQPIIGKAYTVRSKAYRQLGQERLANADFDKAYELDPENYSYKYFTITNHLASFVSDSDYINPRDIGRLGLIGIIVLVFVLIFKLALPAPRKDNDR
jgi:tetratricopeptide (TPR) repeat protein